MNGRQKREPRWARKISWEIDTDKSHTLRLPGRQLSVEEAAGTISHKWHWVSFNTVHRGMFGWLEPPLPKVV